MSAALKCDICGKLYVKNDCIHTMKIGKRNLSGNYYNIFDGDVCNNCIEQLSSVMTSMGCKNSYISKMAKQYASEEKQEEANE